MSAQLPAVPGSGEGTGPRAIGVYAMPLADVGLLCSLTPGPYGTAPTLEVCRTVQYIYRNYLGALQRALPGELAKSPDRRLTRRNLAALVAELSGSKSVTQVIGELFALSMAIGFLLPSVDRAPIDRAVAELRRALDRDEDGGEFGDETLPLALPVDELAPGDRALHDSIACRVIGTARPLCTLRKVNHRSFDWRRLLGTLRRAGLVNEPDAVRFGAAGVAAIISEDAGRPLDAQITRLLRMRRLLALLVLGFDAGPFERGIADLKQLKATAAAGGQTPRRKRRIDRAAIPADDQAALMTAFESSARQRRRLAEIVEEAQPRHSRRRRLKFKNWVRPVSQRIACRLHESYLGSLAVCAPHYLSGSLAERVTSEPVAIVISDWRATMKPKTIATALVRLRPLWIRMGIAPGSLEFLDGHISALQAEVVRRRRWRAPWRSKFIVDQALAAFWDASDRLLLIQRAPCPLCDVAPIAERMRNLIMVALSAALFPRLKNVAMMQLGVHLVFRDDLYRLIFDGAEMKSHLGWQRDIPGILLSPLRFYLEDLRSLIHPSTPEIVVWPSRTGFALSQSGIGKIIPRTMAELVGDRISSQHLRHIGMTSAAHLRDSEPELPMKVGGHQASLKSEIHYIDIAPGETRAAAKAADDVGAVLRGLFADRIGA